MATSIAIAMLNDGEPFEKIVKYTGLSFEEIQKVAEERLI
jgi:cytidylate kinase